MGEATPPPLPVELRAIEKAPVLAPGPQATPQYPDTLRGSGILGTVLLEGVVTPKGRLDMETVRVLESPHAALTQAALDAVARWRFLPAEVAEISPECLAKRSPDECQRRARFKKMPATVRLPVVFAPDA